MESALCKVQYVEKTETAFNIRLNNHRKDISNQSKIYLSRFAFQKTWTLNQYACKIYINRTTK